MRVWAALAAGAAFGLATGAAQAQGSTLPTDFVQTLQINTRSKFEPVSYHEENGILRNASPARTALYFASTGLVATWAVEQLPKSARKPAGYLLAAFEAFVVSRNCFRNPRTRSSLGLTVTLFALKF